MAIESDHVRSQYFLIVLGELREAYTRLMHFECLFVFICIFGIFGHLRGVAKIAAASMESSKKRGEPRDKIER
jgi:hypothetical protein